MLIDKVIENINNIFRFKTRVVNIGDVPLGGNNSIRIQSMTTTDTMNKKATVEQAIRIIEAGADYIRITAPGVNDAQNLDVIKKELRVRGFQTPLIADIHYTPNAAEIAARIVEKVRINPGNYADKKKFEMKEYSDSEYNAELDRIRNKFFPLVKICKEYGTAMRIGTNHGSLSDRIMSRYGDTPQGMVESAIEFVRFCEELNYYDIVLSMKSSNPIVMVQAYRLLVNRMIELGMNYPLHLGVTEAGDGEDGRIKSAIGIGTLLEEGFGDTIRVSLTEEPEYEIPVCKKLVEKYSQNISASKEQINIIPIEYNKWDTTPILNIGGKNVPVVIVSTDNFSDKEAWSLAGDIFPDYLYSESKIMNNENSSFPVYKYNDIIQFEEINFVEINVDKVSGEFFNRKYNNTVFVIYTKEKNALFALRNFVFLLKQNKLENPIIIKIVSEVKDKERFLIDCSIIAGGLLIDGIGNGIWIENKNFGTEEITNLSFGILQASRARISKTDYISCPSCGRTLFDLQETTARIKEATSHLKGIKIAIMGCIVNGIGEMADADYGYVGSGQGKITLYKGKEIVKRNIDSTVAVEELINVIKENNDWKEKK
jgi:(E)-4-hydroxy-3-methylbut-2-enyl-diphosphate synthase